MEKEMTEPTTCGASDVSEIDTDDEDECDEISADEGSSQEFSVEESFSDDASVEGDSCADSDVDGVKGDMEQVESGGESPENNDGKGFAQPDNSSPSSEDEVNVEKCPICLMKVCGQELGKPGCCNHRFCLECILEWSKVLKYVIGGAGAEAPYFVPSIQNRHSRSSLTSMLFHLLPDVGL